MKRNELYVSKVVNMNKPTVKPKPFSEPPDCVCCGRKHIVNVHVLSDGSPVGSECALVISRADLRRFTKPTKNVLAFFASRGLVWSGQSYLPEVTA